RTGREVRRSPGRGAQWWLPPDDRVSVTTPPNCANRRRTTVSTVRATGGTVALRVKDIAPLHGHHAKPAHPPPARHRPTTPSVAPLSAFGQPTAPRAARP